MSQTEYLVDQVEAGRFPRPVGTDHSKDLPVFQVETNLLYRCNTSKRMG